MSIEIEKGFGIFGVCLVIAAVSLAMWGLIEDRLEYKEDVKLCEDKGIKYNNKISGYVECVELVNNELIYTYHERVK